MVITLDHSLPSEEELTVPEINVSISGLKAGAFHLGKECEFDNNEFILCRQETNDPRQCLQEGKNVTNCAMGFFRKVKKSCHEEFKQYANCLDKSSPAMQFTFCRKTQAVFDQCMLDSLNMERPHYGYFSRVKVHDAKRPKPEPTPPAFYPDAPTPLPPKTDNDPPAKYGSRFIL